MSFRYGKRSIQILSTVDHQMAKVAQTALTYTPYDIAIISGLRTDEEQLKIYRNNKSKLNGIPKGLRIGNFTGTGISMHQKRLAIDFMAYGPDGGTWVHEYYFPIIEAFQRACIEHKVEMIWGGCWDKPLTRINDVKKESQRYTRRMLALNKKPFLDLGHLQLERRSQ
ncbi:MAG: hypothetical protein COB09_18465 [Thalassobium sp.]|nr:MAG: hypothetical protein COB09_18465 [Thalassobium sp.]